MQSIELNVKKWQRPWLTLIESKYQMAGMHVQFYLTQVSHGAEMGGGVMKSSNADLYYANINV